MTRDIIEINNFIVLIEQSMSHETIVDTCGLGVNAIGFAFYGSGNVELSISDQFTKKIYQNTKGTALSFYANENIVFKHKVKENIPMQCVAFFCKTDSILQLPKEEKAFYEQYMYDLLFPDRNFVEGPGFYMTPPMLDAINKIYGSKHMGATRNMFLKSQVTELLAHFFSHLSKLDHQEDLRLPDEEKLYEAREILTQNIERPPSLDELAKLIGLNDYKLKKNFKELFGMPVFKYLQNERLTKAHDMLRTTDSTIQETAWAVGYESLGSFSNAFQKHFGFRPSDVRQ